MTTSTSTATSRPTPTSTSTSTLSGVQAGSLIVASMMGTGVFTTSGFVLAELPSPMAVLLVWVLAGLLAMAGAAVYGELGAMMPRVGGEYVYLSRLHPAVGFLAGFVSLIVGFAAPMAAGAEAFSRYLQTVWPGAPGALSGYLLLAVVTAVHAVNVRWAGRLQAWLTGINLLTILAFTGLLGWATLVSPPDIQLSSFVDITPKSVPGGVAIGLVMVSYSYFGWNAAAYVAGELRNPGRTLPRVLLVACALVTVLYVALNAVLLSVLPHERAAGKLEIAHIAAEQTFGPAAARWLSLLIAVVLAASVSALAMTGARVSLAMAEDDRFFRVFARRNRWGAPSAGVLLQGSLALAMSVTATFETLLIYVGFTLSLSAGAAVLAAMVLRRREPDALRPYRTPGWPLVPLAYLALTVWMTGQAIVQRPQAAAAGGLTLAVGYLLYLSWRRR